MLARETSAFDVIIGVIPRARRFSVHLLEDFCRGEFGLGTLFNCLGQDLIIWPGKRRESVSTQQAPPILDRDPPVD